MRAPAPDPNAPPPPPSNNDRPRRKAPKHANVDAAFLAAQRAIKRIVKQKFEGDRDTASFEGSSLDVVLDVIVPALNAEGLSFRQPPRFVTYGDRAVSLVDTIIAHPESGTSMKDEGLPVCAGILPSKEQGARLSYARKQAALSMMGVAPQRDGDAHPAADATPLPASAATSSARLVLIDGASLIYRAFHACPVLSREADGAPVGAVLGFLGMLRRLIERLRETQGAGTHIAVIFDAGRRTFRNALSADYKANRPATPDALARQLPLMPKACEALGVAWAMQPGFEADDLIATFARAAVAEGATVTILSPDKDLMQLIGPSVCILDPTDHKLSAIDRQACLEKFGVPPNQACDAQALIGDAADNVAGAPGIGPVYAGALLEKFGTLEGILARIDEVEERHRSAIEANAARLLIAKQLVTLRTDVPVRLSWRAFAAAETDAEALDAFVADIGPTRAPPPPVAATVSHPSQGDGPDDPKLCAELLLRLSRVKRLAALPEWEGDFAFRTHRMSEAQVRTLDMAFEQKRAALGGARTEPSPSSPPGTATQGEASQPLGAVEAEHGAGSRPASPAPALGSM